MNGDRSGTEEVWLVQIILEKGLRLTVLRLTDSTTFVPHI